MQDQIRLSFVLHNHRWSSTHDCHLIMCKDTVLPDSFSTTNYMSAKA